MRRTIRWLTDSIDLRPGRRFLLPIGLLFLGLVAACAPSIDQREAVHVLTYDGAVDPVMSRYLDRGIDEAERTDARAVVLRLDTPGGLVSSMEDIVKRINSSEIPVIVWVTPSGGHAASAGTFITMAAHVAAMSPATRIGAASPVGGSGEDLDRTLQEKVTEDLVALITGIAQERGRNAEWAEQAVRDAASASSSEAVELGVVDFEARTLDSLLEQSEGRTVRVGEDAREVTMDVLDAPVVENNRTFVERFFALISDPNIAFLLLSLGATALFIELLHPGYIFPGVFGVIALILGFLSLGTLPFNWAAVALIILAFGLFAAEVFVSGFGALGIGGAIALILGGLLLFDTGNSDYQVNRWLLFGVAGVLAVFFVMALTTLVRTRRAPAYMGAQSLVGRTAVARTALDPDGFVFFQGARWRARSEAGPVDEGDSVTVTEVDGLKLTVRKEAEEREGT
jgi:membrane-bound serine protease (ClpP class)